MNRLLKNKMSLTSKGTDLAGLQFSYIREMQLLCTITLKTDNLAVVVFMLPDIFFFALTLNGNSSRL